jgi:hypothetical protein
LLAQETQKNISVYSREFEESADLEPFDVLSDGDFSSPADAVIITVDSELVAEFLTSVQLIPVAEYSEEMTEFFAPKTAEGVSAYVLAVLMDRGYSISTIQAINAFSATHIAKAPDGFENSVVFMGYDNCAAITAFSQYDDYVSCVCSYIVPDLSAGELLDAYKTYFKNTYGTALLTGHTDQLDAAELRAVIG